MTTALDWSWSDAMMKDGATLREIWVREITDLFDHRVPILVETMVGQTGGLRHQVQVPPGVRVRTEVELRGRSFFGPKFRIDRGKAYCMYSDGKSREYEPRDPKLLFVGADLKRAKVGQSNG